MLIVQRLIFPNNLELADYLAFQHLNPHSLKITLPDGNSISLNVPEGTQPNTTMRIANKGLPNRGGPNGHVLVKILGQVPTLLDREDLKQIEYIEKKYS